MQLNSITIMDLIDYGNAALGVIMATTQLRGRSTLRARCSSSCWRRFFIPMRQLGSFFHIAMNGMAASDKIFRLLDLSEPARRRQLSRGRHCAAACAFLRAGARNSARCRSDDPAGQIRLARRRVGLRQVDDLRTFDGPEQGLHRLSMTVGGAELRNIEEASLMRRIAYVIMANKNKKANTRLYYKKRRSIYLSDMVKATRKME